MNVRFEKTEAGEFAILPREEYEALIAKVADADEDAGTARLVGQTRRDVAEGVILLPMSVVSRLANGDNAVRVLREWRGITQVELASRTDLSQGHMSDIETGRRTGTAAALRQIADALQVPLDVLA